MEVISNTQPEVGNCPGHFSIRAYVSNMRKIDRKKCWPFPSEAKVQTLPPIRVSTFNYWQCKEKEEIANTQNTGLIPNDTCFETNDDIPSHEAASMLLACSQRAYREKCLEGKTTEGHGPIYGNGVVYGPEEAATQQKNLEKQIANVRNNKLFSIDILIDSQLEVKERTFDVETTDTDANADANAIELEFQEKEADFVTEREDMYPSRDDELAAIKNNLLKGVEDVINENVNRDTAENTKGKGKQIKDSKIRRPRSKRPDVTRKNLTKTKKPIGRTVSPSVSLDVRPGVTRKNITKAKDPAGKTVSPNISVDGVKEGNRDIIENDHVSLENEASNSRANMRRRRKVRSLDDILKDAPLRVCEKASAFNEESVVDHADTDSESNEETSHDIGETGCDSNGDGVANKVDTRAGSDRDSAFQTCSGSNGESVTEHVGSESDDETLGIDLNLSPTHQEVNIKKRKFMQDGGSTEMSAAKKHDFTVPCDDQSLSFLAMRGRMLEYEERDSFSRNQQGEPQVRLKRTESPIGNSQVSNGKLPFTPLKKDAEAHFETGCSSLGNQLENPAIQNEPNIPKKQSRRRNNRNPQKDLSGGVRKDSAELLARNLQEKQVLSNTGNKNCLPETRTLGMMDPGQFDKEEARRHQILGCLAEKRSRNRDKTQLRPIQPLEYGSQVNCRPPRASDGFQFPLNPSNQSEIFGRSAYVNSMYPKNQVPLSGTTHFLFGQNPPFSKSQEKPSNATQLPLGNFSRACGDPSSLFMKNPDKSAARTQYLAPHSGLGNQNPGYSQSGSCQNLIRDDQPGWTPMMPNCCLPFGMRNPNTTNRNSQYLELFPNGCAHPLANPPGNNKKNLDMGTSKRLYPLPSQVREMQLNPQSICPNNLYSNGNMTQLLRLVHAGVHPSQPINLDTATQKLSFPPSVAHLNQPETPRLMNPPPSKYLNRNHRPTKSNGHYPTVPEFNPVRASAIPIPEVIIIDPPPRGKEKLGNLLSISQPKDSFVSTPSQAPYSAIKGSETLSNGKRKRPQQDSVNGFCHLNKNPAELLLPEYMSGPAAKRHR